MEPSEHAAAACRFEYVPAEPEPLSDEVKAILNEQNVDFETSGLKYLPNEARVGRHTPPPPFLAHTFTAALQCRQPPALSC